MRHTQAPFTQEQVDSINGFQRSGMMHPFTCGCDHDGDNLQSVHWRARRSPRAIGSLEDEILALSPAGFWKLDEESGSTAFDSSGNGRHGTYVGAVMLADVIAPDGHPCPLFDGGHIQIADADAFSINSSSSGLSLFALTKLASVPNGRRFVITKGAVGQYEWELTTAASGNFAASILTPAGGTLSRRLSTTNDVGTAWTALSCVFDAVYRDAGVRIFRDGITWMPSTKTSTAGDTYANNAAAVRIGARGDDASSPLLGHGARMAIFPSRLSHDQIGRLMRAAEYEGWF